MHAFENSSVDSSGDSHSKPLIVCSSLGAIARDPTFNTPGRIRTCDRRFRKPLLYPTELRAHLFERNSEKVSYPAGFLHPVELRPAGSEPATCGLGNRRSIHLSYERDIVTSLIVSHRRVWCQRVCDSFPQKRARLFVSVREESSWLAECSGNNMGAVGEESLRFDPRSR